jgi:hypothetical protein
MIKCQLLVTPWAQIVVVCWHRILNVYLPSFEIQVPYFKLASNFWRVHNEKLQKFTCSVRRFRPAACK